MRRNSVTNRNGGSRKVFHIAPSYGRFTGTGVTIRYGVTRAKLLGPSWRFPERVERPHSLATVRAQNRLPVACGVLGGATWLR
jgi:hypothetical protein